MTSHLAFSELAFKRAFGETSRRDFAFGKDRNLGPQPGTRTLVPGVLQSRVAKFANRDRGHSSRSRGICAPSRYLHRIADTAASHRRSQAGNAYLSRRIGLARKTGTRS